MRLGIIAYICGLSLASLTPRPEVWAGVTTVLLSLAFFGLAGKRRGVGARLACLAAAAMLGCGWHLLWAGARLDRQLPPALEGRDMQVRGIVRGLPRRFDEIQQFAFQIESSDSGFQQRKVLLNHYGGEEILAGARYALEVRMNRPRGLANPGVFDYEAWLFQRGIAGRGYVRELVQVLPQEGNARFDALRARLKAGILRLAGDSTSAGVIVALALGDDSGLTDEHWELFRQTGTNHLFVISGLHIGLISLLAWGLTLLLAKRLPWLLLIAPAQKIALPPALAAAWAYGLISGFGLPAQRALIMASVFMLAALLRIKQPMSLRFLLAMAVVLTLNPLSFLGMGFWLSFLAVGSLLLIQSRGSRAAGASAWIGGGLRPQLAVAAGLLVPLLFWLGEVSLLGPLVNLPAIPLVGFVVVPLCLLSLCLLAISETLAGWCLHLAAWLLGLLLWGLREALALGSQFAILERGAPSLATMALLGVGSVLALLPRGFPGRALAPVLLMPLLFAPAKASRQDLLRLDVLDVGQGLSVLVRTRNHTLLYDTGASFSPNASMGDRVVVPLLERMDIGKLDALVLSHADDDHSGGFAAVAESLPVDRVYASFEVARAPGAFHLCRDFIAWRWDEVEFRFLHPRAAHSPPGNDNNNSCVLQISGKGFGALLPGDIESEVERELAALLRGKLRSELLIASHHGSNTSSSWPFLKMTDPDHVVFTAGYRNAFGHPSPLVLERAAFFTPNLRSTSEEGMISFILPEAGASLRVRSFRADHPRYWRASGAVPPSAVLQ